MIQQATISSPFAPVYQSDLARTIGVLQQLQILYATQSNDTSLTDVIQVIHDMQREFGENSLLENVIQALVGRQLGQQLANRRQQRHIEAVEVLQ